MYQANPLSVYTDKFPLKNKKGETTADLDQRCPTRCGGGRERAHRRGPRQGGQRPGDAALGLPSSDHWARLASATRMLPRLTQELDDLRLQNVRHLVLHAVPPGSGPRP